MWGTLKELRSTNCGQCHMPWPVWFPWKPAAIYSLDEHFDARLQTLATAARRLHETKDAPVGRLGHCIADEYENLWQRELPEWLAGERTIYYTTLLVIRKHLPEGYLKQRFFPLVVAPSHCRTAMILPSQFWSNGLLEHWRQP